MQVTQVIKKYGYTLEEVALKIGYAHASSLRVCLSNKNGKPANPNLSTLRAIADAVGCSVGEFFDDEREVLTKKGWNGTQPKLDIKRVMLAQNINISDLSVRLGTTRQRVSDMLKQESMTISKLQRVATALSVPLTELFSYE